MLADIYEVGRHGTCAVRTVMITLQHAFYGVMRLNSALSNVWERHGFSPSASKAKAHSLFTLRYT